MLPEYMYKYLNQTSSWEDTTKTSENHTELVPPEYLNPNTQHRAPEYHETLHWKDTTEKIPLDYLKPSTEQMPVELLSVFWNIQYLQTTENLR